MVITMNVGYKKRGRPPGRRDSIGVKRKRRSRFQIEDAVRRAGVEVVESSGREREREKPVKPVRENKGGRCCVVEEDYCFACKDGGDLVICDVLNCPKVYHQECIIMKDSDSDDFICEWHVCSLCEKSAKYMCYTCTYSLCKGCLKEAEFFFVRGNKGFCKTCMELITMIDKNEQENDMTQIDFNDRSSLEFLFKDYWIHLKRKLSLTSDELAEARKEFTRSPIFVGIEESADELHILNGDQASNSEKYSRHHHISSSETRHSESHSEPSTTTAGRMFVSENTQWASKELLEFVAHMKDGDRSMLSQFDVQALLLEYITQNNLRVPGDKSLIVCDSRLKRLFGKVYLRRFEMLKLLGSHFLNENDDIEGVTSDNKLCHLDYGGHCKSLAEVDNFNGAISRGEFSQLGSEGSCEPLTKMDTKIECTTHNKDDGRRHPSDVHDYAAIDSHNLKLLYLSRDLIEALLKDVELHEKVVGSFVRTRNYSLGEGHDMYNLVQVVGIGREDELYEAGKETPDVTLKILNSNKIEYISVDSLSNQEFTEVECERLRQSINCGLLTQMTVDEVRKKAVALQKVRINWLEKEKLRLSRLRDRASEKGWRKQLREYVKKLQLLDKTGECLQKLHEIPKVHASQEMNQSHHSENDEALSGDQRQEDSMRLKDDGLDWEGREPVSPGRVLSISNDTLSKTLESFIIDSDPFMSMLLEWGGDKGHSAISANVTMNDSLLNQRSDTHHSNWLDKSTDQVEPSVFDIGVCKGEAVVISKSSSESANESLSAGVIASSEIDRIWHYRDPSGKIQGPFSILQMDTWSRRQFPANMRIWRAEEMEEDSILLTDALNGNFHKELPPLDSDSSQPWRVTHTSLNNSFDNMESGCRDNSPIPIDKRLNALRSNSGLTDPSKVANGNIHHLNSGSGKLYVGNSKSHESTQLERASSIIVETTDHHDAATISGSKHQIFSPMSSDFSVKPMEGADSCGASYISGPNAPLSQVGDLYFQKISGEHVPMGAGMDGETTPPDISASSSVEIQGFAAEPPASALDGVLTNLVAESVSEVWPSKISNNSSLFSVHSSNGFKLPGKIFELTSHSVKEPEADLGSVSQSEGWELSPAQKQEPPTSRVTAQNAAAQNHAQDHWGENPSSFHYSAASSGMANQCGNYSYPVLPPSDSVRPANWASLLIEKHGAMPNTEFSMPFSNNLNSCTDPVPENMNAGWEIPETNASVNFGRGDAASDGNSSGGWELPQKNAIVNFGGGGAASQVKNSVGWGTMHQGHTSFLWNAPVSASTWENSQKPNGETNYGQGTIEFRGGYHTSGGSFGYGGRGGSFCSGSGGLVHCGGGEGSSNSGCHNSGFPGGRERSFNNESHGGSFSDGGHGGSFPSGVQGRSSRPGGKIPCRHFERGYCWYGANCNFLHS